MQGFDFNSREVDVRCAAAGNLLPPRRPRTGAGRLCILGESLRLPKATLTGRGAQPSTSPPCGADRWGTMSFPICTSRISNRTFDSLRLECFVLIECRNQAIHPLRDFFLNRRRQGALQDDRKNDPHYCRHIQHEAEKLWIKRRHSIPASGGNASGPVLMFLSYHQSGDRFYSDAETNSQTSTELAVAPQHLCRSLGGRAILPADATNDDRRNPKVGAPVDRGYFCLRLHRLSHRIVWCPWRDLNPHALASNRF